MLRRISTMPLEERFTRSLFALILIGSFFVSWGKWASLILGILFLCSVLQGGCFTCEIYKKFFGKQS